MTNANGTETQIPADRMVGFGAGISLGFANYFKFHGRSSRGAFWYWTQFAIIVAVVSAIIDFSVFAGNDLEPIGTLTSLILAIPGISASVRRLHDIDKSGWWYLIAFTIIGIPFLIYWLAQPGQRSENQHGPDHEAGR